MRTATIMLSFLASVATAGAAVAAGREGLAMSLMVISGLPLLAFIGPRDLFAREPDVPVAIILWLAIASEGATIAAILTHTTWLPWALRTYFLVIQMVLVGNLNRHFKNL